MKIHEYTNMLICILEYLINGQCLRFHIVQTLPIYVEHRLRYEYFIMCTVKIHCYYGLPWKQLYLYSLNEFFLEDIFSLI